MPGVLIRDDDTNVTTPPECLDHLYRPFWDRGLPVNLSVIPEVRMDIRLPDGNFEGFLFGPDVGSPATKPITDQSALVDYIRQYGYGVAQHGLTHEFFDGKPEFDNDDEPMLLARLDRGRKILTDARLTPAAFVAPQDKLTPAAFRVAARRYRIISTGWYEWRRLPPTWRPAYAIKKIGRLPHWRVRNTLLLSHPGCLLSRFRDYATLLDQVKQTVLNNDLTVLVTHWWEYFPAGHPDPEFIHTLHQVAEFLADPRVRVLRFSNIA